ncbi:MAG: MgtC/SapB family protein [Ruminococcaceae bacterium]|nr:MgtC/SapB family protein [Oscillospiraceae bacterium]
MELREITYLSIALRIVFAFLMGGALGWERERRSRAAGLRTYMLVCVGACIIMLTNQYIYQFFHTGDPVRMGAQVVSGIGFLGAGTIVVTKRNQIKGLTTAAGLWAAAAVGLALGIGFYEAAIVGGLLIFLILTAVHSLDSLIRKNAQRVELYAEVDNKVNVGQLARSIRALGVTISSIQLDHEYAPSAGVRALMITMRKSKKLKREELLSSIQEIEGIMYIEEL